MRLICLPAALLPWITATAMLAVLAGCSSSGRGYNPMDDYDLVSPTTVHDAPVTQGDYPEEQVRHGKYLAELLACGVCHTDGAIIGEPVAGHEFAGSEIGIAWSNPFATKHPGVLFPANITPDVDTGIGSWSDDELVRLIRTGMDNHGKRQIPVMPWPGYARLTDEDARAIAAFLKSLPPVRHRVPENTIPGQVTSARYVHFGVYRDKP